MRKLFRRPLIINKSLQEELAAGRLELQKQRLD